MFRGYEINPSTDMRLDFMSPVYILKLKRYFEDIQICFIFSNLIVCYTRLKE